LCKPTLVYGFLPKYFIKFTSLVKIKFSLLDANTNILLLRGEKCGSVLLRASMVKLNSITADGIIIARADREMAQILGAKLRAWEAKSCYSVLLCVCVTA
jgi:hypothetical protein